MKFYIVTVVFIVLIFLGLMLGSDNNAKLIAVIGILVVYIIIVVIGVSNIGFNLFINSTLTIKTTNNEIAITFDDGPNEELTPRVLDILASYNAKATFFCIGNKAEKNASLLKRIQSEGHKIGNHTFEHSVWFPFWSVNRIKESIIKTDNVFENAKIENTGLFRPPFGITNNLISVAVRSLNKQSVGWSIRTKDTVRTSLKVLNIVDKKLKAGSIVLLHDTNENICEELEQILILCQQKKLKPVTL
ncbi:MAG: polysaccharide deacetylase family protein [Marinilabiliaceae bacterium]|nr:polysaccharide deacetylase family protein [Marinilabiliaceae bacterium]